METIRLNTENEQQWKSLDVAISFGPLLRYFKNTQAPNNSVKKTIYECIVKELEKFPEVIKPFTKLEFLNKTPELIDLLLMSISPLANAYNKKPLAIGSIFPARLFYLDDTFEAIISKDNQDFLFDKINHSSNTFRLFYAMVLDKCYNIKTDFYNFEYITIENKERNTIKYYKIFPNTQFIEIEPKAKLPTYNEEWPTMLIDNGDNFEKLTKELPSELFKMEGFTIFLAQEITNFEAMNQLKKLVLNLQNENEADSLNELERILGILLENTDVQVGLVPFFKVNNQIVTDTSYYKKTILISTVDQQPSAYINPRSAADHFKDKYEPVILSVVNDDTKVENSVLTGLKLLNIGSYMVTPIRNSNGQLLGILELATHQSNGTSKQLVVKLDPALHLIADMFEFMINQFDAKITTIIKEQFTPLQSAVEWKFNEVAWEILSANSNQKTIPNVSFEDVYPLYGAIDIRNSSIERNKATQTDIANQLETTKSVIKFILSKIEMPLLEVIHFKVETLLTTIEKEFTATIEQKIVDFFATEIHPTLTHLSESYVDLYQEINDYMEKSNLKTGSFYNNNREYENSLQKINNTINAVLENERVKQQKIYPHYFEKYRTDGLEFTIYIGQNLKPDKKFNPMYLKNLRLWQLSTMAFIGNATQKSSYKMKIPLKTTQLILAHNKPIAISFRKDERRFDVEGSYNIRYEIMKKRIDKIEIKNNGERLTKPDYVAIVYSSPIEAGEYREHIEFLINKGIYNPIYEELELENMQGVSGLKAFRVAINYSFFQD
ncbi:hypothetical protein [Flavobacterium turcicum]|uniref:GAF domain-containing protein n=1 Tax=Flavobacterium turcicum TaxID=2764718 RepID=A0ABR7JE67_9FLAO|nr:hypothetical protein [Flavobacterium turcicum]MBC5862799.1 hypothetical protein [Flavobacterium turcicum]NHL01531.1 hypothetical protein [Flavobacterium turcicum]